MESILNNNAVLGLQMRLNRFLPEKKRIKEDGIIGKETIGQIENFYNNYSLNTDKDRDVEDPLRETISQEEIKCLLGKECESCEHNKNQLLNQLSEFAEIPTKRDDLEAAYLCQVAYNYYDGTVNKSIQPLDWSVLANPNEVFGDAFKLVGKISGFQSLVFTKQQGKLVYYAYCTVGTNSLADWIWGNIPQGITGISPQYTQSAANAKLLHKKAKEQGAVLWFVGHSLGGGLASNNSLITGRYAITFNAAGLNPIRQGMSILQNWNDTYRNSKVHAYILEGEILNSTMALLGQRAYGNRTILSMDVDKNNNKTTDECGNVLYMDEKGNYLNRYGNVGKVVDSATFVKHGMDVVITHSTLRYNNK